MGKTGSLASSGFSLVEVALSLAILSVAMVGVLSLLPVGLDAARQVHAEAVAVQVVRERIADIESGNRQAGAFQAYPETFYSVDGQTNATGYFAVTVEQTNLRADSCRYFLTLRWPASQTTNRPLVQQRVFVSDQVRSW